jgi:hypothetical protein
MSPQAECRSSCRASRQAQRDRAAGDQQQRAAGDVKRQTLATQQRAGKAAVLGDGQRVVATAEVDLARHRRLARKRQRVVVRAEQHVADDAGRQRPRSARDLADYGVGAEVDRDAAWGSGSGGGDRAAVLDQRQAAGLVEDRGCEAVDARRGRLDRTAVADGLHRRPGIDGAGVAADPKLLSTRISNPHPGRPPTCRRLKSSASSSSAVYAVAHLNRKGVLAGPTTSVQPANYH